MIWTIKKIRKQNDERWWKRKETDTLQKVKYIAYKRKAVNNMTTWHGPVKLKKASDQ